MVNGDTVIESDESFYVDLANPSNATISDGQGVGTILNDDFPSISINDRSLAEGHSGTRSMVFTVTLSSSSSQTVTVDYATADGTATVADGDYMADSNTLTFSPGQTTQTITITVNGDEKYELDESFYVDLDNADNATIGDGRGEGTITNDDPQPAVSINSMSWLTEGNTSTQSMVFTVTLSNPSSQTVTVDYATADGTATVVDEDYTSIQTTTLTFLPGQTARTIPVTVHGDTKFEPNESFYVNLGNPSNATIGDGQGVGTITNDDSQPTISIEDVSVTEGNSGTTSSMVFTVTLSNPSYLTVSVTYSTTNGTAVAPGDYTAVSTTTLTFSPGQTTRTITITVNGDSAVEPNEVFYVNLANPTHATISDAQGAGTILNDDS
jgi:disulfide oxidoreductase YuzD